MQQNHYDLATPDGQIISLKKLSAHTLEARVSIQDISPSFAGYRIKGAQLFFNVKSTLAQIGINAIAKNITLLPEQNAAELLVHLDAIGPLAHKMLPLFEIGQHIGKLFAADKQRLVYDPDYLLRLSNQTDHYGRPLLSLGGSLKFEKIDGRMVAFLALLKGTLAYERKVESFLPTLARALKRPELPTRALLQLYQKWQPGKPQRLQKGKILLLRTAPLHVRTVFARVVPELLPKGYHHTSASILEPSTEASGDVYEFYGSSSLEITHIPLEFYTLEPYREYISFSRENSLKHVFDTPLKLFQAFQTAPEPLKSKSAVYIVKEEQLRNLCPKIGSPKNPIPMNFLDSFTLASRPV